MKWLLKNGSTIEWTGAVDVVLKGSERDLLLAAMLNPPELNEALKEAFEKHGKDNLD